MSKYDSLLQVYKDIHKCHICSKMDPEKALRKIDAVNMKADVFIVSQSLAENHIRKTGVNFFDINGNVGNTGNNLEKLLKAIGQTVHPPIEVKLSNGNIIAKRESNLISVYNSEITQCYPGKNNKRNADRKPNIEEIQNCRKKGFLAQEIKILKPKIVMLMGKVSRDTFLKYFMKTAHPSSLTEHIAQIIKNGKMPEYALDGYKFFIMPIQHASGANPQFSKMSQDPKLIEMLKEVLQ